MKISSRITVALILLIALYWLYPLRNSTDSGFNKRAEGGNSPKLNTTFVDVAMAAKISTNLEGLSSDQFRGIYEECKLISINQREEGRDFMNLKKEDFPKIFEVTGFNSGYVIPYAVAFQLGDINTVESVIMICTFPPPEFEDKWGGVTVKRFGELNKENVFSVVN